jgi:hypothetical protein
LLAGIRNSKIDPPRRDVRADARDPSWRVTMKLGR